MTEESDSKDFFLKAVDTTQSIINRMANNSFLIKGWTITLVVAALLLKGTQKEVFLAIIPLITFWLLDAYFLRQERLYREVYKKIVKNKSDTVENLFDMNTDEFKKDHSIIDAIISKTLLWFYGTIFVLIVGYFVLIHYSWTIIYDNIIRIPENLLT